MQRLLTSAEPVVAVGGFTAAPPRRTIRTHRELPSSRAVVGGLLVAAAALSTFVVARGGDSAPTTRYVVAARELAPGTVIGPADLALVALDLPAAQAGSAFQGPAALLGGAARGPVAQGGLLTNSVIQPNPASAGQGDPTGVHQALLRFREVSFAVPRARALLGDLLPGDRVDVVAASEDTTVVLVQQALVVATSAAREDTLVLSDDVVITLALTDGAEALAVAHGAATAELTVLRSTRATDRLADRFPLPTGAPTPVASAGGTATTTPTDSAREVAR